MTIIIMNTTTEYNYILHLSASQGPTSQHVTAVDAEIRRRSSALFILKLKEKRHLTQTTIDDIIESSQILFAQSIEHVKAGVEDKLVEEGMQVHGLETLFKSIVDPFDGLMTRYQQERYFVENLGLIVSFHEYAAARLFHIVTSPIYFLVGTN